MLFDWLEIVRRWVSRKTRSLVGNGAGVPRGRALSSYRVWFELLEDRFTPANTYQWLGTHQRQCLGSQYKLG